MSITNNIGLRLGAGGGRRSPDMILVYEIPAAGTNIKLAIQANSSWFSTGQSVVIDWGDDSANETVSATSGHTGYIGHTYASAGTYTIKISGSMTMYGRSSLVDIAGQALLTRVDSFGKLGITSFERAFRGCTGFTSVPKTLPDSVTNMLYMFYNCYGNAFNPDLSAWDMSNVDSISGMFVNCSGFAFKPDMKSWTLRTGVITTGIFTGSRTQLPTWLDELLVAWAANPNQGSNITINFSPNKFTEVEGEPLPAVANALEYLTTTKGWTIATANS